ncbi:MAG TPA: MBL fold metallo-hydrolase [Dehalococcoidales bacterium]|nr:MBL fold metallo-hydrolase [Dehalococcoidales bacterium]
MRLITLSENTAGQPDVLAEWGLSILIEQKERRILMDSGAGLSVIKNAELLGVDLTAIDTIILSHGHYDHTGGLQQLLTAIGHEVTIVAHPDVFAPKYSRVKGKPERYIGLPFDRQKLEDLGARFILSREPVTITEKIITSGEIPMATDFEKIASSFIQKAGDVFIPDPLLDDLSVIISTPLGLVVVLGCAHRGMINILRHAREVTGQAKIHMVVGGSHLKDSKDEQVWLAISALNEMGVQKLAVCHCTGMPATLLLAQTYGKDFIFNQTGSVIEIKDN